MLCLMELLVWVVGEHGCPFTSEHFLMMRLRVSFRNEVADGIVRFMQFHDVFGGRGQTIFSKGFFLSFHSLRDRIADGFYLLFCS